MAVKAAIALAALSAVGPIHKCWNRQEEISKLGPKLETNRAEQPKGKAGRQSRGEGWESQAGHGAQHGAESTQISDL